MFMYVNQLLDVKKKVCGACYESYYLFIYEAFSMSEITLLYSEMKTRLDQIIVTRRTLSPSFG